MRGRTAEERHADPLHARVVQRPPAATVARATVRCCARRVGPLMPSAMSSSPMSFRCATSSKCFIDRLPHPPRAARLEDKVAFRRQGGFRRAGRCLRAASVDRLRCARSGKRCVSWRPAPRAELQGLAG